ncbi:MAG: hypothetical protein U1D66_07795 [Erythrobacter sp.]|nr:hypothetical protein [Erythrobacter sp.]
MITPLFYFVALTMAASSGTGCKVGLMEGDYHLIDVCDPIISGENAYSVTYQASLSPEPASQQVAVYTVDGEWFVRIAGYRWRGDKVETRRRDLPISAADAEALIKKTNPSIIQRLSKLPYYGADDLICTDGASLHLGSGLIVAARR